MKLKQLLILVVCSLSALSAEDKFFRFSVDQDRLHAAPDFSFLNQPLGPADRIFVKDGHFYCVGADLKPHTADDRRIRLFGVNFAFAGLFPAEADSPRIAKRLRRLGVNLVRLHHMDSRPDTNSANAGSILTDGPYPTINPIAAARLRTFLDALKREGIYVNLNLKVGYRFRPDVDNTPPLPNGAPMPFQTKPLHIFQPRMIALQEEYTAKVIDALKLKNDPVLAMVEINNENSLLGFWQRGQLDRYAQGEYRAELMRQWNAFLKAKEGNVPLVADKDGANSRAEEYLRFLTAADRAYLRRILAIVRAKTDSLVPVAGTQGYWAGGLLGMESHADMDYHDEHFYIDLTDFANREFDPQDWRFRDDSSAGTGMMRFPFVAASRQAGMPFTVSEYNQPWPNRQAAEINPTTAAFAAFQDWDAIMYFAYASTRDWDTALPAFFDLNGDWSKAINIGQSAWLFRSGAISPGRSAVRIPISDELSMRAARASRPGVAQFLTGALKYDPAIALEHPVMLAREEGQSHTPLPRASSPYRADTGELVYDRDGKVFVIQAAQAAGVFGFPAGAVQAGDIAIETNPGARGFVSALVTSLDGRPIRESRRLLMTTPGYTLNSRRDTNPPIPQNLVPYLNQTGWWTLEPDSPGKASADRNRPVAPVWMEAVPLTVTMRSSATGVTVYPLDGAGTRMYPLLERNAKHIAGGFQILLPADGPTPSPWYEVVAVSQTQTEFHWPRNAKAAVSLTYDDGVDVHLDHVVPDLEAAGLHGTFYVTGQSQSVYRRMAEWRDLVKNGHELGNHAIFHPCQRVSPNGKVQDWITPERALENYSVRQIVLELRAMNTTLRALDGKESHTYAYNCGNYMVGGNISFVDDIRPFFRAARAGMGPIVADPLSVDPFLVPSWSVENTSADDMIGYVKRAIEKGGIATFMFHGVGGGHGINIDRSAHQKLLAWLREHSAEVWTDTFENVVQHMLAERKRLGADAR